MLDEIIDSVRARVPEITGREAELRARALASPPARDFTSALTGAGLGVIAEYKRRSPSAGPIGSDDPAAVAAAYEAGGACALSVLTEPEWFGAAPDDLRRARSATGLPVLRKDFTLHPSQVWEGRASGADAALAIVAVLADDELEAVVQAAKEAQMALLMEVHDEGELARAIEAGATLIGVNNRDLETFEVDVTTAERLGPLIPEGLTAVAESGVGTPALAARMRAAGYDAVLVGEAAMRAQDPSAFVRALREAE